MSRLLPLTCAALLLAAPSPAFADVEPTPPSALPPLESLRSPTLAATMSVLCMPAALAVASPLIFFGLTSGGPTGSVLANGLTVLTPLGLGLGQVYAGHPQRGLAVGLGGSGILAAGYGLSALTAMSVGPAAGQAVLGGSGVALLGYGAWAAWDAYRLVDRENEILRATPIDY